MNFKDAIATDIKAVFLNAEEFSDMHDIDGKMMPVQVDDNEAIERQKRFNQHMDSLYVKQLLIYVAESDFGPLPALGRYIKFDKKTYEIVDAASEDGIHTLTLEANKSGR